MQKHTDKAIN